MAEAFKLEVTAAKWDTTYGQATKGLGTPEGSYTKNTTHIADHLAILHSDGVKKPSLERLCLELLDFATR
jgi:putative ATP-dependent endonuclease of the OLD family